MLIIRLSRQGKKNEPYFRLIINEKTKDTVGDYLESLGFYDPRKKILKMNEERIKYWLSKGAQASGTVHNILVTRGLISGKKIKKGGNKKEEIKVEGQAEKKTGTGPQAAPAENTATPKEEKKEKAKVSEEKPAEKK
ncbi:MAG: 30S ribosomal protein S16 [Patescibacteria group bacterium]